MLILVSDSSLSLPPSPFRPSSTHSAPCSNSQDLITHGSGGSFRHHINFPPFPVLFLPQDVITLGSGGSCDVNVQGPNVAAQHASIERKRQQVFCRALVSGERGRRIRYSAGHG